MFVGRLILPLLNNQIDVLILSFFTAAECLKQLCKRWGPLLRWVTSGNQLYLLMRLCLKPS